MRSLVRSLVLASLLLLPQGATAAPEADVGALRSHVDFLADDLLEGRDTGSRGHEIAARYAASIFELLGLEPGNGDSYLQRIRFASAERESSSLTVRGAGRSRRLVWKDDYLISPDPAHARVELSAPVVFVGYGIEAPELGRNDYAGVDVAGKIVLLVSGAPSNFSTTLRAHYSSSRTKVETAVRHGAVGLLTVRSRVDEQRSPWKRRLAYAGHPTLRWKSPDGALDDTASQLRLEASLSPAGADKLLAAAGESFERLLGELAIDAARSRALGVTLSAKTASRISEVSSPNVVALLRGSDAALADQYVVVSAHLDHVGVGPEVDGDHIYNGYYDNAMGSSIVLELARMLAAAPERPRRSILFLLVTGEEKGLLGSDYFATWPTVPRDALVADLNIDMPLLIAPVADLLALGGEHSSLGAVAERAAAANGFTISPDPHPEEVYFVRSDQYSFVRRGVPSLFLDTGTSTRGGGDAAEKAAAEFERDHYHRPSDDSSVGTDWATAARFVATARDILREVADAPEAPSWNAGDFFGERFGRSRR